MGKEKLSLVSIFLMALVLPGCDTLSIFSSPIEERGVSGFLTDNVLRLKINKALADFEFVHQMDLLIHQGHVLIVGHVLKDAIRETIQQRVSKIEGVKAFYNYLSVGPVHLDDYMHDVTLTRKLKAVLFFDSRLSARNYHVCVNQSRAYVLGTAESPQDLVWIRELTSDMALRQVNLDHILIKRKK